MKDWRNIKNGKEIPSLNYSDQPYMIKNKNNILLCCMTTGKGSEGAKGEKVITLRSLDYGETWCDLRSMENEDAPENAYSVFLQTNYGRVYCFYNFNKDNIRKVKADNPPYEDGYCYRVDSLGTYAFRYSDDFGLSWSKKRYYVPIRNFDIDINNSYKGKLQFFWNVGKPLIDDNTAYLSLHKVGGFGIDFFTSSEGVLIRSDNIMFEKDISKLNFKTLPDGMVGIRAPEGGGKISEEHSYVLLDDGSFFTVFRTIDGRSAYSYSRDKGKSWEKSKYMPIKNPRAANFVWKLSNSKYLYWFHNHSGKNYEGRNPAWCLVGDEKDGEIIWSQPEILLYSDDPMIRISYPDLIEVNNNYYLSETEKENARVHKIDKEFIKKILNSSLSKKHDEKSLIFDSKNNIELPIFKSFIIRDKYKKNHGYKDLRKGFTFDICIDYNNQNIEIFNSFTDDCKGIKIEIANNRVNFIMGDGQFINSWKSDLNSIKEGVNYISIIIDGGPKIIYYVINGKFNDGIKRNYGWGRFSDKFKNFNGIKSVKLNSLVKYIKIYDKALLTCEVVGNYRFECYNK